MMMRLLLLTLGVVFSHEANEPHDWDFLHCNLFPTHYPQFKIACDTGFLTAVLTKDNFNSEIQKIKQMQMYGQCLSPSTSNTVTKNRVRRHGVHLYDEYCHDRDDDEYCHEGLAMECQPNHDDPTHEHCDVTDKLDNKFCDGCTYRITCKDGTDLVDEDGNSINVDVTKNTIEIVHKAINKQKAFEGKCKKVTVVATTSTGSTQQKAQKIQLLLQRNHPNKDWINNGNGNMGYCPCKLGFCGGCGCHGNCSGGRRRCPDGYDMIVYGNATGYEIPYCQIGRECAAGYRPYADVWESGYEKSQTCIADSSYTRCEFADCTGTASGQPKNDWRRCDYGETGGYCYGDWMDEAKNPNLHVIIVIDMAVVNDDFWTFIMPAQIQMHLNNIPFVVGTTYEVLFVGPDGVKFNYPLNNGQRWRRDIYNGQSVDLSDCIITDRVVLMQRIKEVTKRIPSAALASLKDIGLGYKSGLSFISDYMEAFAPVGTKNVLFLHAIGRNVDVSPSQFNNFLNFLSAFERAHPDMKLMNHFMFAESAASMLAKVKSLGAKNGGKVQMSLGFKNVGATDSLLGYEVPEFGGITDNSGVSTGVSTSCSANPCLNGCTCQQSCRDENDYVCVPQPGQPFVGKNCEFEATVQCTANRAIRISVPTAAIDQYAIGVPNVIVQGCNNAPSYICNDRPSCGPASTPVGGFYTLECTNNQLIESGGVFKFQQTFIFDRASDVISMPRPIVKVECNMQTRPATSLITPQIRDPNSMTQTLFWQPAFQFYKTAWGQPMILANNGERLANGAVAYIIGEQIHVRIDASLNGVAPQSLPNRYEISLESCSIASSKGGSAPILIISNGLAVPNTPFPVSVDHPIGFMGGGVPVESMGVGFAFQVFTFQAGASLQLTCSVSVKNGRRKRSLEEDESAHGRKVVAEFLLFEKGYKNDQEFPVLAIEQEFDRSLLMDRPGDNFDDVIPMTHTISDIPIWIMVLFGITVFMAVILGGVCYRRNYIVDPHIGMDDSKARLFN